MEGWRADRKALRSLCRPAALLEASNMSWSNTSSPGDPHLRRLCRRLLDHFTQPRRGDAAATYGRDPAPERAGESARESAF